MQHNAQRLLQTCEKLLRRPNLTVRLADLDGDHSARCEFDVTTEGYPDLTGPLRLVIDTSQIGTIRAVLHEFLHIILHPQLIALSGDLEETAVFALEQELFRKKYFTVARLQRWRRLIDNVIARSPQS